MPYNIINDIKLNYSQKFDIDRALKSSPGPTFSSKENFAENKFIENHYSFSTEKMVTGLDGRPWAPLPRPNPLVWGGVIIPSHFDFFCFLGGSRAL